MSLPRCLVRLGPSAKVFGAFYFFYLQKKKDGERKSSAVDLSSRSQCELEKRRAQQSADPQLGKSFGTGEMEGCFLILLLTASPARTRGTRGKRSLGSWRNLPFPDSSRMGEVGRSWALPGILETPARRGGGPGPRGPGDRPQHTPFPARRGGKGCSAESQSWDQCYKAHPLGGSGNERCGEESQSTFCFNGAVESSSVLN